jgi:polyisoprenoid-binding protein YceI
MRHVLTACAMFVLAGVGPQSDAADQRAAASDAAQPAATSVPAGAYTLDKAHASLIFRVSHLGFSNFTAHFTRFDAQLQFDPANPATSRVKVTIDPRSIESDNPPSGFLDMLRGAQWLSAAQFPEMTFGSTHIERIGPNALRINGELTLHGVTRPVTLDATYNGGYAGFPMDPHARIGFSAHGSLKRSEFGIAYGIPAPGTTMGVSDNVDLIVEAEFSGPAWAGTPAAQK